jgi:serine/threonine-protein kinase RsbW
MCDTSALGASGEAGCNGQAKKGQEEALGMAAKTPLTESGKIWAGTATVRTTSDIEPVLEVLVDALERNTFTRKEIFGIRLSLTEAVVNAVKHGHRGDPGKQVRIRYLINQVGLLAQVEDEGPGFARAKVADPLAPENLERDTGRGILLMQHYMSEVRFNAVGNCVTLIKHRQAPNAV